MLLEKAQLEYLKIFSISKDYFENSLGNLMEKGYAS